MTIFITGHPKGQLPLASPTTLLVLLSSSDSRSLFQQYSGSHKFISIQFRLKFTVGIRHHIINHSLLLGLAQGLLGSTCLCLFPEAQFCIFLGRVTSLPKLHRGWWNNLACASPPPRRNMWLMIRMYGVKLERGKMVLVTKLSLTERRTLQWDFFTASHSLL